MCVFLFSKAISCFSEAGTEATECQSAADCKSNQVSLQQIVTKFFLEKCFKIWYKSFHRFATFRQTHAKTNSSWNSPRWARVPRLWWWWLVMVMVMVMVMAMVMAINFSFLTLAWITLNFFQSSDCNDNEICYLDTMVSILDFKQEKDCSSL